MGAFGDSMTRNPSYAAPLSYALNAPFAVVAQAGASSSVLISLIQASTVPTEVDESVVLIGTNDLATLTAAETIANLQAIAGLVPNPHFVTILPFGNAVDWTAAKETKRQTINAWIKTQAGHTDAEATMGDLTDPAQPILKAANDSGDGRHLSPAGNNALAAVIYAQSFSSVPLWT